MAEPDSLTLRQLRILSDQLKKASQGLGEGNARLLALEQEMLIAQQHGCGMKCSLPRFML